MGKTYQFSKMPLNQGSRMKGGRVKAFGYVAAACLLGAAALVYSDMVGSAEKLVDRDGRVLYYLHEDGRVSYPNGKTAGYMRGHSFSLPDGKPMFEKNDSQLDYPAGKDSKAWGKE